MQWTGVVCIAKAVVADFHLVFLLYPCSLLPISPPRKSTGLELRIEFLFVIMIILLEHGLLEKGWWGWHKQILIWWWRAFLFCLLNKINVILLQGLFQKGEKETRVFEFFLKKKKLLCTHSTAETTRTQSAYKWKTVVVGWCSITTWKGLFCMPVEAFSLFTRFSLQGPTWTIFVVLTQVSITVGKRKMGTWGKRKKSGLLRNSLQNNMMSRMMMTMKGNGIIYKQGMFPGNEFSSTNNV